LEIVGDKKLETDLLDNEIAQKVQDTISKNNETSKVENERIRLLEIENEQLKKERERLMNE
jgi:hypothetical protein